jgi:hypothetical protein
VALRVEGLPALQENLLLARVVLRPAGNEEVLAPGFCIYYPTAEREQWGSAAIGSWTLPAADAAGAAAITGLRLPTGERGRDLLLAPGPVGAGGRLVTYALGPAVLERIDLALALRPGEECSAGVQRRFARVLKRVSVPKRLPPALLRGAESGRVGEPISILLSEPAPVEFLVFLDGALVGRERVEGTVKPSIVLSRPGQYGIEVWITDPREGTRTLERIFPTVGP